VFVNRNDERVLAEMTVPVRRSLWMYLSVREEMIRLFICAWMKHTQCVTVYIPNYSSMDIWIVIAYEWCMSTENVFAMHRIRRKKYSHALCVLSDKPRGTKIGERDDTICNNHRASLDQRWLRFKLFGRQGQFGSCGCETFVVIQKNWSKSDGRRRRRSPNVPPKRFIAHIG
jgi:hypothetical protein